METSHKQRFKSDSNPQPGGLHRNALSTAPLKRPPQKYKEHGAEVNLDRRFMLWKQFKQY